MKKQDQNIHNLSKKEWRESKAVLINKENNCKKDGTADTTIALSLRRLRKEDGQLKAGWDGIERP